MPSSINTKKNISTPYTNHLKANVKRGSLRQPEKRT